VNEDDGIPTLDQVVRPGAERRTEPRESRKGSGQATLSDAEIEAIVARVMDRYAEALEKSIERAIRRALERKESDRNRE